MRKTSNSGRIRSPDGLKCSVFKAIRNVETNVEDNSENIRCPFARMDDELEIADFRIFGNDEMNEEEKSMDKLQEKNHHESLMIFSYAEPLLVDTVLTVQWIKACSTGDLQTVGKLVKEKPYLISCAPTINHGYSGLHYAAKDGHSSVLRFLIANGADVNLRTASGYTPLHVAAIGKQHEIISILLRDYGADGSIEDYAGHNYRHYMIEEQGNTYSRRNDVNATRNVSKYDSQQNDTSASELTQFPRLKSFRKAVHGRMRFFTDK